MEGFLSLDSSLSATCLLLQSSKSINSAAHTNFSLCEMHSCCWTSAFLLLPRCWAWGSGDTCTWHLAALLLPLAWRRGRNPQYSSAFYPQRPQRWPNLDFLQLSAIAQKQHSPRSLHSRSWRFSLSWPWLWHFHPKSVSLGNIKMVIFKYFFNLTKITIYIYVLGSPDKCLGDKTKLSPHPTK